MTDREKPDWDELFKKVDTKSFEDEEEKPKLKMPEEIKKVLKCCNDSIGCDICPYGEEADCNWNKNADALSYIQKLEAELAAAVNDLATIHKCAPCKHRSGNDYISNNCFGCVNFCNFEWRGLCEDNGGKE